MQRSPGAARPAAPCKNNISSCNAHARDAMILEIQHETSLEYTMPVSEWITELRMEPVSGQTQSCHSFHLLVSQPVSPFRYLDGFGNRVHHFNILATHQTVRILAASIVET